MPGIIYIMFTGMSHDKLQYMYQRLQKYIGDHKQNLFLILLFAIFVTVYSLFFTPFISGSSCFQEVDIRLPATYHINCDSWDFMASGKDFPEHFRTSNTRMSRPGYPFLLSIGYGIGELLVGNVSLLEQFYGAIFLNFLFAVTTALLLYYLVNEFFNKRIALISSLFLLLSTHFRVFLPQVHTEIAGDFVIIASLFMLYLYIKKQNVFRLILLSFIVGLLMLIKFVFALPIFFGILALYHKKYKDLLIFGVVILIPTVLWYLFVIKVLHLPFESAEVTLYKQGTWFLSLLLQPQHLWVIVHAFFLTLAYFFMDTLLAFLILPVLFAIYGLIKFEYRHKYLFISLFVFSFIMMLFLMLWGGPRFSFGLFPIIIPLAVYGGSVLWNTGKKTTRTVIVISVVITTVLTLTNIYMIIPTYDYNDIRTKSRACDLVFEESAWFCKQ